MNANRKPLTEEFEPSFTLFIEAEGKLLGVTGTLPVLPSQYRGSVWLFLSSLDQLELDDAGEPADDDGDDGDFKAGKDL